MHLIYLKKQKQKADKRLDDFIFFLIFKTYTFKKHKAASDSVLWILCTLVLHFFLKFIPLSSNLCIAFLACTRMDTLCGLSFRLTLSVPWGALR